MKSEKRLLDTLKDMGYGVNKRNGIIYSNNMSFDLKNQKATMMDDSWEIKELNKIKRNYSLKTVEEIAKKKRWVIKKKEQYKLTMRRY